MIEWLSEYGLFLAKTLTWVVAVLVAAGGLSLIVRSARGMSADGLEVTHLNEHLRETREQLEHRLLDGRALKAALKAHKAEAKARAKAHKRGEPARRRVFVLGFDGDIQASAVGSLREEITAILQIAAPEDEVVLRLESPGGLVHSYGLAASQLTRIRSHGLKLTVAVDKVAASGGYLMACVADRIVAAPFAILGSIGVVAQLPNFHRLLQKNQIDFELHTAGEYKRTLTLFGENTDSARLKFREELESTHDLFKRFVSEHRPLLDIEQVATGEHWYGRQALELKLVDEITTSDDLLLERARDSEVYQLRQRRKKPLGERLAGGLARFADSLRGRLAQSDLPGA